jgi:hypothetical protein
MINTVMTSSNQVEWMAWYSHLERQGDTVGEGRMPCKQLQGSWSSNAWGAAQQVLMALWLHNKGRGPGSLLRVQGCAYVKNNAHARSFSLPMPRSATASPAYPVHRHGALVRWPQAEHHLAELRPFLLLIGEERAAGLGLLADAAELKEHNAWVREGERASQKVGRRRLQP